MKRLRDEKGVITIFVLVSLLFMISFLIATYALASNKVKTQKEIIAETREIYESKYTMDEVYNSYFTSDTIIPIYTVEQLLAIGTGNNISVNRKNIYIF